MNLIYNYKVNQLISDMCSHIKYFEIKFYGLILKKNELTHFLDCRNLFELSKFSFSSVKFVEYISTLQYEFNNRF